MDKKVDRFPEKKKITVSKGLMNSYLKYICYHISHNINKEPTQFSVFKMT